MLRRRHGWAEERGQQEERWSQISGPRTPVGAAGVLDPTRSLPNTAARPSRLVRAMTERLRGPGGIYNLGNLIALAGGVTVQMIDAPPAQSARDAILGYFFGTDGASLLTLAIIIFIVSGEVYHRAWAGRAVPDQRLNRLGDLLSAAAAIVLTAALVAFGDVLLALAAGFLLAGGKLATAVAANDTPQRLVSVFRSAVVLSRFPSLGSLALAVAHVVSRDLPASDAVLPAITFFCFLLWLWADLLLLRGRRGS